MQKGKYNTINTIQDHEVVVKVKEAQWNRCQLIGIETSNQCVSEDNAWI